MATSNTPPVGTGAVTYGFFTYQWLKDGVELQSSAHYSGATSSYLYIYDYTPEDAGRYSVRVTNKGGSTTSNEAVVTITLPAPPVMTTNPSDKTALAGDYYVYFSAYASGVGVKYCWQKDGVDLVSSARYSGADSSSLYIYNPQPSDAGTYTVRAYNAAGSVTGKPATLTVNMPSLPVITSQNQRGNISMVEGEAISFSCYINSVTNTAYQWYKDGQPISGATSQYYSKYNVTLDDAGVYKLAATNPSGAIYSEEITVTISGAVAPVFVRQPDNQAAYAGRSATLESAATGRPAPTYQWYKNGVSISYSSATPYCGIYNAQSSDAGAYTVVATNKAGSVTSNAATLTILSPDSGKPLGIYPLTKEIGCGRVVYRVWVNSNASCTVVNDTPWLSVSRAKGGYEGPVDITVAPNPIPCARTATITIAGIKHTLTQHAAGTPVRELWAAGSNDNGQLGVYKPQDPNGFKYIPLENVKSVAVGNSHTLFLKDDGTLWGVGYNSYGELGDGTTTTRPAPVLIASGVIDAAAGANFSLFVKTDGSLWSMGMNNTGALGTGTTTYYQATATPVHVADNVVAVAAGDYHSLFKKADGTLWGMGSNGAGQLGDGTSTQRTSPVRITDNVRDIAAGASSSFYIKTDGSLWAMGDNSMGRLGIGATSCTLNPVQIAPNVQSIRVGFRQSVFLKTDGSLWGMGNNTNGQLGKAPYNQTTPFQFATGAINVAIGDTHTVYIKSDGSLWGLGDNQGNQLGSNVSWSISDPVQLAAQATAVYAGYDRTYYKDNDGLLWAVGRGMLGSDDASATQSNIPLHVATDIQAVSAGGASTLYLTTGSDVYSFGGNGNGQLADGTTRDRYVPLKIATGARSIVAGDISLVTKTDGTLWAAGDNSYGQLGSQASLQTQPTLVPVSASVQAAAAGGNDSFHIDTEGVLWALGNNTYNKLGVVAPDASTNSARLQVSADVLAVSAAYNHTLLLKTDATLWSVGDNTYGQLGRSGEAGTLGRVDGNIAAIAAGSYYSLWLKNDGSIWASGYNVEGQFGGGNAGNMTQTPVLTANNARAIAAGYEHSLYIDTNNNLWAAGGNYYGQFADGTTTNSRVYKKIAANIDAIAAGSSHTLFIATGDIRLDPPPPPVITDFSPASITAQTKVVITGSNFNDCAGVYFGAVPADQFTVDSPTQITAYAPVIPAESGGHVYVGTFDGVASSAATYTAAYPPFIVEQIPVQAARAGETITIDPLVIGTPDPTITWEISTDNGATWRPLTIDGTHNIDANGVLKITNIQLSLDGNRYRFTATNINGATTSQPFTLTVQHAPVENNPLSAQRAIVGNTATFNANIDASPAPTGYQWQVSTNGSTSWTNLRDGAGITGATAARLQIPVTAAMNGNRYRCVVTNTIGSVNTQPVTLTTSNSPLVTPSGLFIASGTLYVSDAGAQTIYRVALATSNAALLAGATGISGATNSATGADARFKSPAGIALTQADKTLHVLDAGNNAIRSITMAGAVTRPLATDNFGNATGITVTPNDTLFIAETNNHVIGRITNTGAGAAPLHDTVSGISGTPGTRDGTGNSGNSGNATAAYNKPAALAVIPGAEALAIADTASHTIRVLDYHNGELSPPADFSTYTLAGAAGQSGALDATGSAARFNAPAGIAANASDIYVADTGNHTIRRIDNADNVTTIAGVAGLAGFADGTGSNARFNTPASLALDATNQNLYIADTANSVIRKLNLTTREVTTLAITATTTGTNSGTTSGTNPPGGGGGGSGSGSGSGGSGSGNGGSGGTGGGGGGGALGLWWLAAIATLIALRGSRRRQH